MQNEPRSTHSPHAPIEPSGFFSGISFKPIIIGVAVDTLATMALTTAYFSFFVVKELAEKGIDGENAFNDYWNSSEGLVASLLLGSLGTVVGGFYAAYKAGKLEMKHGALVGIGSIILGLILQSGGSESEQPEWFIAISFAAAIPAGALGGLIAEMFKNATGRGKVGPQGQWPGR